MVTTGLLIEPLDTVHPGERWGCTLVGDPLMRADDKFVRGLGGRVLASLSDLRIVRELRLRAEAKRTALTRQLADLTARNVVELMPEAAKELADQERLLFQLTEAEGLA